MIECLTETTTCIVAKYDVMLNRVAGKWFFFFNKFYSFKITCVLFSIQKAHKLFSIQKAHKLFSL